MSSKGDINRYTLGRLLGRPGGFGAAYEAERDDGLRCVVKLFHGLSHSSAEDMRRLRLSLARMTLVESPYVIPVIDAGVNVDVVGSPQPWIAMPLMKGARSLDQVLAGGGAVAVGYAHKVIEQVARGLGALHAAGLLHRDLKPSNILVDGAGKAWLIDFDLIKVCDITTRTPAGGQLGTYPWMAPEQLIGPVGPATDLWAVGLVLHEMLTGRQPLLAHAQAGQSALFRAINSQPLVGPDVPAPYDQLIRALLRKLPVARPADAQTVIDWLSAPGSVSLAPPVGGSTPSPRWTVNSREEVDAVEIARGGDLGEIATVDATIRARADHPRIRRATQRLRLPLALEPGDAITDGCDNLFAELERSADPVEAAIQRHLAEQANAPGDVTLLPFRRVDDVGVDAAVHMLRVGARHRDEARGRPMIGTIHCSAQLLEDPSRVLPLLAACSLMRVDGWRLWCDGLQPDCGDSVIRAVRDAAEALTASGAQVWVRACGLSRWAMLTSAGAGIAWRAGRGLWTLPTRSPHRVPERVEVDVLAGPVPREVAERLALHRPRMLACGCRACAGRLLPPEGRQTVLHNLAILGRQLAGSLVADDVLARLDAAARLRGEIAEAVDWHGELKDLAAVRRVVSDRERTQANPPALLLVG